MMGIADFAERVGLAPSAVRFYESKGILLPAKRLENGYRCYSEEQVGRAKLINSLRQSGIVLSDIRRFMEAGEDVRVRMLECWRKEAEARLLSIRIANQYLNGFRQDAGSLHLTRWDEPVTMIMQTFTLDKPLQSYTDALEMAAENLRASNLRTQGAGFVRIIESLKHVITIEVGFAVAASAGRRTKSLPQGAHVEVIPPTLFVTVDCSWEDSHVCMQTILYLQRFGFEPSGKRLERHFPHSHKYELMIPVVQSGFRVDLQVT
jgi:DNA-binding transcriptional MerR regulator